MNPRSARALWLALFLPVLSVSAFALPGDAAAILAHCGPPSSDQVLRDRMPQMVRVISYSDTELLFSPVDGDWSFASARRAGIPLQQDALVDSMRCVGDALEEVAERPLETSTPVNQETPSVAASSAKYDRIFLWALWGVFLGVIYFAIRPYTRKEVVKSTVPEAPRAPTRKPSAVGVRFQRPKDLEE